VSKSKRNRKTRLSRVQLYLLGKGPTQAAEREIYRDSLRGARR